MSGSGNGYKCIGVIGGMGPTTSIHFYELVINRFQERKGARYNYEFPEMMIHNVPSPDNVAAGVNEELRTFMLDSCSKLEKAGVDFITVPCNSAHVFIDDLIEFSSVPVINILEETANTAKRCGLKNVLVLGTWSTLKHGLYNSWLEKLGVPYQTPNEKDQKVLTELILKVCDGSVDENAKQRFADLIAGYSDVDSVILGCTELPQVASAKIGVPVFDSLEILADSVFNFSCE